MAIVTNLDDGLHSIDLEFQGVSGVIAAYLLEDHGERAIIEIGPGSTLQTLLAGLQALNVNPESITKILVTHIHLDHAGASGTYLRQFPQAHLFVHESGAAHMIDPTKLLRSAHRIYGPMMDTLWGSFEAVPENRLTPLNDGDVVTVGNREIVAVYTPGHAWHHVAFHDPDRESIFAGDVAAIRLQGFDYVRPPTPPPDVDLEAWAQSLDTLSKLHARALYLTHFGGFRNVAEHLHQAHDQLYAWGEDVHAAMQSGQQDIDVVDTLRMRADRELLAVTQDAEILRRYELAAPLGMCVEGYLRYYRKRDQQTSGC